MSTQTPLSHPPPATAPPDRAAVRANKLDLLERLADGLAHEIKNPLHSMVINLEVLKRRLARAQNAQGEGLDDVMRYAGVLGEELERVSRRIELLLRLSRPERGPEETSLDELVGELMELIHLEARQRGATVDYRPGRDLAPVRVARGPVRQAILNLVLHALQGAGAGETLRITVLSDAGGGRLAIRAGAPPQDPGAAADGRMAVAAALAASVGGRVDASASPDGPVEYILCLEKRPPPA